MKQIDAKPSEARRVPKYDRWVLWYGAAGGAAMLAFIMMANGWPWVSLLMIGPPVFIVTVSIVLLFKNTH